MPNSPAYYDISPTLNERTAVFPGDRPFKRSVLLEFERGHHLELSSLEGTVHVGAHVDAPSHYHPDGVSIDQRDLSIYFGDCQVISVVKPRDLRIRPADLGGRAITAPRVLFRTGSFPDPHRWRDDFVSLTPELIDFLASQKVKLVGIDTPSIDPADSKTLDTHRAVYAQDMAILEGIVLDGVPEGVYVLSALPLKLEGFDASPVRAVLWKK